MLKKLSLIIFITCAYASEYGLIEIEKNQKSPKKELNEWEFKAIGDSIMEYLKKYKLSSTICISKRCIIEQITKPRLKTPPKAELFSFQEIESSSRSLGNLILKLNLKKDNLAKLYDGYYNNIPEEELKTLLKLNNIKNINNINKLERSMGKIEGCIFQLSREIKKYGKIKKEIDITLQTSTNLSAEKAWTYFRKNPPNCFEKNELTKEQFLEVARSDWYGLQ